MRGKISLLLIMALIILYFFAEPAAGEEPAINVNPPVFSHKGGWYNKPFELKLDNPVRKGTIYYTLDGSEPDKDSLIYSSPIKITTPLAFPFKSPGINKFLPSPDKDCFMGTVVRACVITPEGQRSEIKTHTYFIHEEDSKRYSFPVISLVFDENSLFNIKDGIYVDGVGREPNYKKKGVEWERPAHIEFFEPDGTLGFSQNIGIRIHGGATRADLPRSLRLYAKSEYDNEKNIKYEVFPGLKKPDGEPLKKFKRLVLRNSGNDSTETYFLDIMMQSLVSHMSFDTQAYRPAIVFFNGVYWGIHNIRERLDERYIENKYDIPSEDVVIMASSLELGLDTGVEGDEKHYYDMVQYIETNDMSRDEHYEYIKTQLDVVNFMEYHLSQIYFVNTDWPGNNMKFWRVRTNGYQEGAGPKDGRWRYMMYDTDFGFDNYKNNTLSHATKAGGGGWPNPDWGTVILRNLLMNHQFKEEFATRFADAINTAFVPHRVIGVIEDLEKLYQPEFREHVNRWKSHSDVSVFNSYYKVRIMKIFAEKRPAVMFEHLSKELDIGQPCNIRLNSNPLRGLIKINTITIDENTLGVKDKPYPWTGTYFSELPVTLTAHPNQGFRFIGWEITGSTGKDVDKESLTIKVIPEEGLTIEAMFERDYAQMFKTLGFPVALMLLLIIIAAVLTVLKKKGMIKTNGF